MDTNCSRNLFAKQPSSVIFSNDDDPFSYTPSHTETRSDEIVTPQKIPTPLHHEIAPRPLPITDLHKDKTTTDSGTLPHLWPSEDLVEILNQVLDLGNRMSILTDHALL